MRLRVYLYRRPNLFNVNDSMYSYIGYNHLKSMYTEEGYKTDDKSLVLYFPERFLNILELRVLVRRCEASGFEEVIITTGNEHLLTTVHSKDIRVVQDEVIVEGSGFKLSNESVGCYTEIGD